MEPASQAVLCSFRNFHIPKRHRNFNEKLKSIENSAACGKATTNQQPKPNPEPKTAVSAINPER
jgi:hypothetical protein